MLELGTLIENGAKPVFAAHLNGEPLTVELDSSAVLKLHDGASGVALYTLLDSRRAQIRTVAQRLFNQRFISRSEDGTRKIIVSAIDLI